MSKKTITVKVSYICTIKIFMSYTLLSSPFKDLLTFVLEML
jgi:hypothetical protein